MRLLVSAWFALLLVAANTAANAAPACFARTELAAKVDEQRPVKGDRRFDTSEPATILAPFKPIAPELRGAIRRVDLPKRLKLIALTLDLCEQPGEVAGYDGAIFDYLRANNIKATLFTGGKWMRSHPTRFAQLVTDPLFEMANHASAHRNLRLLGGTALTNEITGPQRAYESIRTSLVAPNQCLAPVAAKLPARMGLFRFPYGACNTASLDAVNDAGLLAIQWDVSTGDPWPGQSAQAIATQMIRSTKPGSIIIAHANGRGHNTAAGLPLAIPKLLAAGYKFVTVSELLAAGRPVIAPTCYNAKPGDTDRYDNPLGLSSKPRSAPVATPPATPSPKPATRERLPWE
jgi:peptidoglycan-N-acetylglucosamine deacetylase